MLVTKTITIKWTSKNKKHFIDLGYNFTKILDEFIVPVEHLSSGSNKMVQVQCDYCGKIVNKQYITYLEQHFSTIIHKDACQDCKGLKQIEGCQLVYGVNGVSQIPAVREKQIQTTIEKYGAINVSQNSGVKEKKKNTFLKNYGVEHYSQTEEYKIRIKETNLERYGTEHHLQNPEIMNKQKETNLERYGSSCVFSNDKIKKIIAKTNLERYGTERVMDVPEIKTRARINANTAMYENGTAPTSRQQKYIHKIIGGELNYPIGTALHDIVLVDEKIIIEYDGSGHKLSVICGNITEEEFDRKELKRNYALLNNGWRIVRIISNTDLIPKDEVLNELLNISKEWFDSKHTWIKFYVDECIVETSQGIQDYSYGELRKITENDLLQDQQPA